MSEPTNIYSYEDLIKKVAREAGIAYHGSAGNERAMIPVDAHDLDLCKSIVDDGIKMFVADAPAKGWRWMRRIASVTMTATRVTGTADAGTGATNLIDATLITSYDTADDLLGWYAYILTGTGAGSYAQITAYDETTGDCTVADWLDENGNAGGADPTTASTFALTPIETIGGDIAKYPLPENFGGEVNGQIEYTSSSNIGTKIVWGDEGQLRSRRALTITTSYPNLAAISPLEPVTSAPSAKRRFQIIFDPQPVSAKTVEFPYTLYFDKLQLEAGVSSSASTTTLVDSTIADFYPDDYFLNWIIKIISGTGKNSYAPISGSTGASGTFTVADWLNIDGGAAGTDPGTSSTYVVQPANNLHPAGFRFDEAILKACLAKAEMEIEDITAGHIAEYNQKVLSGAYRVDARSGPRSVGSMDKTKRDYRSRVWSDVTTSWDV